MRVGRGLILLLAGLVLLAAPPMALATPDSTPPVLQSLFISPTTVDLHGVGADVTVTAHIPDDISGFDTGYCTVQSGLQEEPAFFSRTSGTALDGVYTGTASLGPYVTLGTWGIGVLFATDVAGNTAMLFPTQTFEVVDTGPLPAPTIGSFSPTSGAVGASVTLTGTNLTDATAVSFHGTPSTSYTVDSATQITVTVPAGASTGTISVTTSGGTGTSATSFIVLPTPTPAPTPTPISTQTMTLKLSGLKSGSLKHGKSVTAKGFVTPTSLVGSKVTLTAQLKKASKWVKAKTASATITATGAYSWKYKPAKKGAYRIQAAIAKNATNAAATTKWLAFKVK